MQDERPRSRGKSSYLHETDVSAITKERKGRNTVDSEFHMANLGLKAENEELKEQVNRLKSELQDEKSNEKCLRREQQVETKLLREEERKKAQSMVTEVRRKLYKEKQQEIAEIRDRLNNEKEKEIVHIIKQKDEELRKAQHNWNHEKEELVQKLRVRYTNETREEAHKTYEKQMRKLENFVEELKEQKRQIEESCKLAQEADKRKAEEIRRMHSEHENELGKLKRSSWQEGRKQMTEIRQLTNIIHQLEKKLGVESGHYIRLQMEKDSLRDKLDRVKATEISGRKSPLFTNTDLTSDLSMFSFPSADDSNPLWLQLKQQKNTISQLQRNLQDKDRRIDLLKQKLFRNRTRIGEGGVMHRSMDDIFTYEAGAYSDDCTSPVFGYSTGSSGTNSIIDDSIQSDESQNAEIIQKLRKELLTLEKAYSLLQAEAESSLDAKRNQMEKENLQMDLIEAHRIIDELNKEMSELQDRNELLEFQLHENLQEKDGEDIVTPKTGHNFNIPTFIVDYEFTKEELECSAEEVKAKLEELENEKKAILGRDEQLTILQAKQLIGKMSKGKFDHRCSSAEDQVLYNDSEDGLLELSFLRTGHSVHCDASVQCQHPVDVQYDLSSYREGLKTLHEGKTFEEAVKTVESAVQCDIMEMKIVDDVEVIEVVDECSRNRLFRKVLPTCDLDIQTDFSEFNEELVHASDGTVSQEWDFEEEKELHVSEVSCGVEVAVQCGIMGTSGHGDDEVVKIIDEKSEVRHFRKIVAEACASVQTDFSGFSDNWEKNMTGDGAVKCRDMELKANSDDKITVTMDKSSKNWLESSDFDIQSDDIKFEECSNHVLTQGNNILMSGRDLERSFSIHEIPKEISRIESAVQCNLIEIGECDGQEIVEVLHESGSWRLRKVVESHDSDAQTDFSEFSTSYVEHSGTEKILGVSEENVEEKHDGEISEKSMLGETWKDFIDDKELGEGARRLDCVVYEKEDVLIVICESYRKNYKGVLIHDRHDELRESVQLGDGAENFQQTVGSRPPQRMSPGHFVDKSITSNETFDFGVQCCEQDNVSSIKDSSCLYCGRGEVTSVDTAIQCEFTDLLSASNDLLDFSSVSELSSVFQETDGGESLIEEVMQLAKECSQNDALIDQHLTDVVRSQEYYEEFKEEQEEVATVDVSVQCDIVTYSMLHDEQCKEKSIEMSTDACTQCSILKWVKTSDCGTQWGDMPNHSFDYPVHSEEGVSCNILGTGKTCDSSVQCSIHEKDEIEIQSDVGRGNTVDPELKQDYPSNMENKGHMVHHGFPLLFSDKAIQCYLLNDGRNLGVVPLKDTSIGQGAIPTKNNTSEETGETLPNFKLDLSVEDIQDGISAEKERASNGTCVIQKEIPDEKMFELTSLQVKNQQLHQQIVELKIQAKRERDEDSNTEENEEHASVNQRSHSSFISIPVSFPKVSNFEATVKPTRVKPREGFLQDIPFVETEITAEEAVVPLFSVDLDNVFSEMEAKPSTTILQVTLQPQLDSDDLESPTVQQGEDEVAGTEVVSRPPVEEPIINEICRGPSLDALDETLQAFGEETLEADNVNKDGVFAFSHGEHNVEEPDQVPCKETGEEREICPLLKERDQTSPPFNEDHFVTKGISGSSFPLSPPGDPPPTPDNPPPVPASSPPALPSVSLPGVLDNELDEDIEELLAEETDGIINPVVVRPTLDREVQAILEGSSASSEPDTILSVDSLCMNQTVPVSGDSGNLGDTVFHEMHDACDYGTEMATSFERRDVISLVDDVISPGEDVISSAGDSSLEALITSPDKTDDNQVKWRTSVPMETKPDGESRNSGRHVAFHDQDSVTESSTSSVVDRGQRRKQIPPPVLPKPKYRSLSLNLPLSELPRVPNNKPQPSSLVAQRDMVDGHFPPPGLVPKRASEFNLGEFDLLKERIVFLERQLKNKENLLQTMRAEATEIETNAYIQKKEEDLKMMDESVRFLKQENQKKERELIAKIGELNKSNFELEQWKSERANSERQQEQMEENINSLQSQLTHLQSVDVDFQELKCRHSRLESENADLHEQVSRLHRADKEFVELERTISNLQTKLKELDEVKRERDKFSEQLKAMKNQKDDLVQKGRKVETERNDFLMNNKLIEQQKENLEARNKALQRTNDTFKTKISTLEKELRDYQRKFFDAQRERDESCSQLRKIEAERDELRKRVNELLECKSDLKQSRSKSRDLEHEVNYLNQQCKKLEAERNELSSELGKCHKEKNTLEGRASELEQLSRGNEKLEEKFHTLKLKIAELTSQRDDAEVQLPTLKAKVALLKKACKEKDEQLEKMKEEIRELKHSIATSALDDLSKIRTYGFSSPENFMKFGGSSDVNNNTSQASCKNSVKGVKYVVLFDYDPSRLSTTGHPEKELKLSEGDVVTVYGEMDLNGYYLAELDGNKGLVSSLYIEEMDEYDVRRVAKRRDLNKDKSPPKKHTVAIPVSPPKTSAILPQLVKRSFVALQDYNPYTSSTSSRPDLEIPLTAGEVITVVGDVDANGYYTVEQRGRLALIPSNLVKPSSPSVTRPKKLNFSDPMQTTERASSAIPAHSVPRLSDMNDLSEQFPSRSSVPPNQTTAEFGLTPTTSYGVTEHVVKQSSVESVLNSWNQQTASNSGITTENRQSGLPAAPRNFRVLRCVNKDGLLLGWLAPEIDELRRNNGHLIKGYKILANGETKLDINSPYMAKALVENLDVSRPIELSIQTVADNGFCSEKTLTHFNEAVMLETTSVSTEGISSLDDGAMYKTFVALYSYDPFKNSPNPNPSLELEFQEGDIIHVADTSRPDGYYLGLVGGKQGLVPSNFIEEIAVATHPHSMKLRKSAREKDFHDSNASLPSNTSTGSRKAKVMVALYDYNPSTQSPNDIPGLELSFRRGQIIRVIGQMRSDGFFEADINGERGLVPSSFLKPCKRKSSKSPHSTNGSSLPRRVQFVNHEEDRRIPTGYV